MHKPKIIPFSPGEGYAETKHCYVPTGKLKARREWCERHNLYLDDQNRVFALVDTPRGQHYMDAITGSMYRDGRCLSGPLSVSGLVQTAKAARVLLGMKAAPSTYGHED